MNRLLKSSAVVITALWVGVLFCLGFIVAPYLFILAAKNSPSVPNTGVAADLIGPLLYSSDLINLIVGVGLVAALVYLRKRGEVPLGSRLFLSEIGVCVAAVCAPLTTGGSHRESKAYKVYWPNGMELFTRRTRPIHCSFSSTGFTKPRRLCSWLVWPLHSFASCA